MVKRVIESAKGYEILTANYVRSNKEMGTLLRVLGFKGYSFDEENNGYILLR